MQSLDAYLRRIGLGEARPAVADAVTLRAGHRAHATSIPFENLDPLRGIPASLEPAALERKLVTERRGGFCFEHNTLLAAALADLGYDDPDRADRHRGAACGRAGSACRAVWAVRLAA